MAVLNQQQHSVVTAETARRVARVVVAAAVAAVTALLGLAWWRNLDSGQDWNLIPGAAAAVWQWRSWLSDRWCGGELKTR